MEMDKNNLCILIFFFGKIPSYFKIFLKGIECNPLVSFKIITDISIYETLPKNLDIVNMTIPEFCQLAKIKISVDIDENIEPYKFCDFRPAYGLIMEDYITDYKYWGYCDMDLILGDLEHFLSPLIGTYDIISSRNSWMHGPFSIYRNSKNVNNLFLKSKDWKNVFESKDYMGFDETGKRMGDMRKLIGSSQSFVSLNQLADPVEGETESFTDVVFKYKSGIKVYAKTLVLDHLSYQDKVSFSSGKIFDTNENEWLCYHWVMEKKLNQFTYPNWSNVPDHLMINRYGFFTKNEYDSIMYQIKICFRNFKAKIKDMRDIIWLKRNGYWSEYYYEKFNDSNPSIVSLINFFVKLKNV